jgi:hypothetical protein
MMRRVSTLCLDSGLHPDILRGVGFPSQQKWDEASRLELAMAGSGLY